MRQGREGSQKRARYNTICHCGYPKPESTAEIWSTSCLQDLLPKQQEHWGMYTPTGLFQAFMTIIPTADNNITRKKNYRPTFLMNIDTKIQNKILVTTSSSKRIIYHIQVGFIPRIQDWFIFENQSM